jgi:hypothetical protein
MRPDKGYDKPCACKMCGSIFIKSVKTGNLCMPCRRRNNYKKKYSYCIGCGVNFRKEVFKAYCGACKPIKYVAKEKVTQPSVNKLVYEIVSFVDSIERRGGYLYNLTDLNNLIHYWDIITPIKGNVYDSYNSGYQLHFMWKDLLNWSIKNRRD